MSADRWAICPRCAAAFENVNEGEVFPDVEANHNLREDWIIYMDYDGEFFVNYNCHCKSCGFEFKFKHTEIVKLKGD